MFISGWMRMGLFIWIVSFVFIVAFNSVDISGCNGKWVYDVKLFPTNNTHGVVHILGEPFFEMLYNSRERCEVTLSINGKDINFESGYGVDRIYEMDCILKCSEISDIMLKEGIKVRITQSSPLESMAGMFCGCYSLERDTSKVESMVEAFCGCESLTSLSGMSKWNTKNVTNMSYMFNGCSSLTELPELLFLIITFKIVDSAIIRIPIRKEIYYLF